MTEIQRYAAFTADPRGGNPAGVVLDAGGLTEAEWLAIAAEVGYSETAFVVSGPAALDHDVDALTKLMTARDWTTVQLVHAAGDRTFDARDPFPVGGVHEDPATGAAAAALGGYLRLVHGVDDTTITVRQGDDRGRPSRITVTLSPGDDRIKVSGTAVPITG